MNTALEKSVWFAVAALTMCTLLLFVFSTPRPAHAAAFDMDMFSSSTISIPGAVQNVVDNLSSTSSAPGSVSGSTGVTSTSTFDSAVSSGLVPHIPTPNVPNLTTAFSAVSSAIENGTGASSTFNASSTAELFNLDNLLARADGSLSGIGTPMALNIKCVILAGIGWPIPGFATECPPQAGRARVTVVKHTVGGGDGAFNFTFSGSSSGTTTITTTSGTGTVSVSLDAGTFTVSEDSHSGWMLSSLSCTSNGTTTGSASGSTGWQLVLSSGASAICTFINSAVTGGGTGTGGGGTGTGGGGTGTGGGGTGTGGGGGSSGGGGGGPISGDGGGGPISQPGSVAGVSTSTPGIPNTGSGGTAFATFLILILSSLIATLGGRILART